MKSIVLSIVVLSAATAVGAQEIGHVVSSTPVIGQIAVPQQVCHDASVVVPGQHHGAGAAIGAVTGAVIGSAIGHGGGRAAASVIGMVGGAIIGDQLAGRDADQLQRVRQCSTQTTYENRVLHYDVVYEYAGRRYSVRMPHDPGPTLAVQIMPVGMAPPTAAAPQPIAGITHIAPIQVAPTVTTIHTTTEYVPYLAPVRIAPIVIGLPMTGWQHTPQQRHRPHRANSAYPRHQMQGQRPHWR